MATPNVAEDQAAKTGASERSVARDAERGEKVCSKALDLVHGISEMVSLSRAQSAARATSGSGRGHMLASPKPPWSFGRVGIVR